MRNAIGTIWRGIKRNAVAGGLLACGAALCILLCGVAQSKGWLGTANLPPAASKVDVAAAVTEPAPEEDLPSTVTLRRGDLEHVVTAGGTIQSTTLLDVNTSLTKRIVAVYVQEGSHVREGDALCQLDTAELDKDIETAQAGIDRAEASDALKLAQAERKLAQLQQALADDEASRSVAIQDALDALEAAKIKMATDTANSQVSKAEMQQAEANFLLAEQQLLTTPERLPNGDPNPEYQVRWDAYNIAVTNLAAVSERYNLNWQNLYQQTYDTCRPTAETAAYEQALAQWDTTVRDDQRDIDDARHTVENCRVTDSAASYRATLERKQVERAQYTITAPGSGTITAVGARLGSTPGAREGDALFTIQNTGSLVVEALVPENEAVGLALSMPVTVTCDALDGREWNGAVSAISPIADEDANFTVTVRLSATEPLAVGMTADIRAFIGLRENVFSVPRTAVVKTEDGETVVYTQDADGSAPRAIPVETGLESGRRVEIDGPDLSEGLVLLTRPEQPQA